MEERGERTGNRERGRKEGGRAGTVNWTSEDLVGERRTRERKTEEGKKSIL